MSVAGVRQVYPGLRCDSEVKKLMFCSDVGHKKLEFMTQSAQSSSARHVSALRVSGAHGWRRSNISLRSRTRLAADIESLYKKSSSDHHAACLAHQLINALQIAACPAAADKSFSRSGELVIQPAGSDLFTGPGSSSRSGKYRSLIHHAGRETGSNRGGTSCGPPPHKDRSAVSETETE